MFLVHLLLQAGRKRTTMTNIVFPRRAGPLDLYPEHSFTPKLPHRGALLLFQTARFVNTALALSASSGERSAVWCGGQNDFKY